MFQSSLLEFDLGLLEEEASTSFSHELAHSAASAKMLEQQMEEDKIGWLESTSDLQAFMDIGALPEIQGDEDVENVIAEVQKMIQSFDEKDGSACHAKEGACDPEEMAAAENLLDELLKSEGLDVDFATLEVPVEEVASADENNLPKDLIDLTNVTKIISENGQEIYIVIEPSPEPPKAETPMTNVSEEDLEWKPNSPKTPKGRPLVKRAPKNKAKKAPYVVDKKERKKQQNVEAARRYRDKKKAEQNVAEEEEQALADRNKELKAQVFNIETELRTMKKLMVELGLLKR